MVDVQHCSKTLSNCGITSISLKYLTLPKTFYFTCIVLSHYSEIWRMYGHYCRKKGSCLLTPETVNNILHT